MSKRSLKSELTPVARACRPLALGVLCGGAVCAVILLGVAGLMAARDIKSTIIGPIMVLALALGAFAGGYICAMKTRERGLLWGIACGGAMFLLLFLSSLFLPGQTFTFILPVKLFCMLLCGAFGGILGVNRRVKF